MRGTVIASAIAFFVVAVIFLVPIGLDVELTKEVRGDRVVVRDRREFYSVGTLFVLDPIMGETRLNRMSVSAGFASALLAGLGTYVALESTRQLKKAGVEAGLVPRPRRLRAPAPPPRS